MAHTRHESDMRRLPLETWFSILWLLVPAGAPAQGRAATLTLEGGTLLNPESPPIANATIVIQDGRILCAGTADTCRRLPGSRSVDVRGAYVGPGLIDAHVHYGQTG